MALLRAYRYELQLAAQLTTSYSLINSRRSIYGGSTYTNRYRSQRDERGKDRVRHRYKGQFLALGKHQLPSYLRQERLQELKSRDYVAIMASACASLYKRSSRCSSMSIWVDKTRRSSTSGNPR